MIPNFVRRQWMKCVLSQPPLRFFSNQPVISSFQEPSSVQLSPQLYRSIKNCASVSTARKLHAQLIFKGLDFSIFLQNNLLGMYFSCGLIDDACWLFAHMNSRNVFTYNTMISGLSSVGRVMDAKKLFDEMPERDSVSWNSMMSGFFRNGMPQETIAIFNLFIRDSTSAVNVNVVSFCCAMKACGALGHNKLALQLHGFAEKFNFASDKTIDSSLIDMYIKCGAVNYAEKVFLRIPNPNLFCYNSVIYGYSKAYGARRALNLFNRMSERDNVSWNTMISILSKEGTGVPTLAMFVEMCTQGFEPNSMTYASVLSICTIIRHLGWGTHFHARLVRMELDFDVFVGNGLINMYAKSGRLELARRVFNSLPNRNAVSWTSLIYGIVYFGFEEEAFLLFNQMRNIPVALDEFILAVILKICSHPKYISIGRQLQALTLKTAMGSFVPVGNALVTMYSKCGDVKSASLSFDIMPVKNIVSWTSIITAFSQAGEIKNALACFDKMPERNVVTWNSMIGMYLQHGLSECGFKLYAQMQRECIRPDEITFAASISGCADLAMLKLGVQIVAQAEKFGFGSDVSVANSVLTMYSKCGQIEEAENVFDAIYVKDLVSWNSMMAGYAQNGQGRKVIEIFEKMLSMKYVPDHISYVSLLSGCSYAGLVNEGKRYFESMYEDYGISPTHEHYSCMVDLLGRAGLLDQAKQMIDEMPFKPNVDVWGALLGACKIHRSTKLAEFALTNLLKLEAHDGGSFTLLAQIYSESGKSESVADVRKLIKKRGIHKNPGCSWIEVDNKAHVFTVGETNHPRVKDIHRMLEITCKTILYESSETKNLRLIAEYYG